MSPPLSVSPLSVSPLSLTLSLLTLSCTPNYPTLQQGRDARSDGNNLHGQRLAACRRHRQRTGPRVRHSRQPAGKICKSPPITLVFFTSRSLPFSSSVALCVSLAFSIFLSASLYPPPLSLCLSISPFSLSVSLYPPSLSLCVSISPFSLSVSQYLLSLSLPLCFSKPPPLSLPFYPPVSVSLSRSAFFYHSTCSVCPRAVIATLLHTPSFPSSLSHTGNDLLDISRRYPIARLQ